MSSREHDEYSVLIAASPGRWPRAQVCGFAVAQARGDTKASPFSHPGDTAGCHDPLTERTPRCHGVIACPRGRQAAEEASRGPWGRPDCRAPVWLSRPVSPCSETERLAKKPRPQLVKRLRSAATVPAA